MRRRPIARRRRRPGPLTILLLMPQQMAGDLLHLVGRERVLLRDREVHVRQVHRDRVDHRPSGSGISWLIDVLEAVPRPLGHLGEFLGADRIALMAGLGKRPHGQGAVMAGRAVLVLAPFGGVLVEEIETALDGGPRVRRFLRRGGLVLLGGNCQTCEECDDERGSEIFHGGTSKRPTHRQIRAPSPLVVYSDRNTACFLPFRSGAAAREDRVMRKLLPTGVVLLTFTGIALLGDLGRPTGSGAGQASAQQPVRPAGADSGYGAAFAAELARVGQISTDEFARRYGGKAKYLDKLDWDPTTAPFYDRFNGDPNQKGLRARARGPEEKKLREGAKKDGKPYPENEPVMVPVNGGFTFPLNPAELAVFKKNGFVVSERMGAQSCTEMFYRIYKRDLPVLITSDAILHAWHRSYDALLEEVETSMLIPALDEMLTAMALQVPKENQQFGDGLFKDSVPDADYFIAVARSLLAGQLVPSALGQDAKVKKTLEACDALQLQKFELFGSYRATDFSQFKPRGHYEKSEELKRYFKSMMWLGRIDLRVAGNPNKSSAPHLTS